MDNRYPILHWLITQVGGPLPSLSFKAFLLSTLILINQQPAYSQPSLVGTWKRSRTTGRDEQNSTIQYLILKADSTFLIPAENNSRNDTKPGWNVSAEQKGKWRLELKNLLVLYLQPLEDKLFLTFKIISLDTSKLVIRSTLARKSNPSLTYYRSNDLTHPTKNVSIENYSVITGLKTLEALEPKDLLGVFRLQAGSYLWYYLTIDSCFKYNIRSQDCLTGKIIDSGNWKISFNRMLELFNTKRKILYDVLQKEQQLILVEPAKRSSFLEDMKRYKYLGLPYYYTSIVGKITNRIK